ncbi:hypothetical protein Btru_036498 [Bulinus truncatus]|nr:hypothetical protein Btru_036498 [Bulinus truncatus]
MPAQTEHHVGGTKLFECRVGGFPRPQIRWYKDGRDITNSSRYQFEHTKDGVISMVIRNITHEDEGHYRCRAENSEGLASTSAYLLVRAHKEVPDEPSTSVHSMQFEEAVAHSDNYKRIKEIRQKIADLDNDNSYQDSYLNKSNRKHQDEDEELTWKSLETVISIQKSSSHLITASSTSSSQKDVVEEESSKISKDMLEKAYHSSDDDLDSVRLKTISERSEPISLQGSLKDSGDELEKSLLMRQTARLFSQEFDEDEDFFKIDSHYQAVMSVMAKEGAAEQPGPTDRRAAQAVGVQVKSDIEKLQVLKTDMRAVTSKSVTSVDSDGITAISKEQLSQVVTEEKILQIDAVRQVDETKLAQSDERTVSKESRQTESVSGAKVESKSTSIKSTSLNTSKMSTVCEASHLVENFGLANEEKSEPPLGDVSKEGDNICPVKQPTEPAASAQELLSTEEVGSKRALTDMLLCSDDDSLKMSPEQTQQALVGEKEIKSEEDEDVEEESDSETEGSVHSVIGIDITASSAVKHSQESIVDTDNVDSGPGLKDNGEGDVLIKSREDYPKIHPEDDIDDGSGVDGRTDEIVEQRTSWVQKVADDKSQPDKEEDATAIGGDKEETPAATKPVLKQKMENIKVEAGKTLRLRTQVQATPRAEVVWSKEGEVIIAGERITIVTEDDVYTLEIENVGEADAGRYRMTAINSAGSVYSEVLVSIAGLPLEAPSQNLSPSLPIGHPQFVMRPQNVTFAEFESIKLSCSTKGDPVPKVTWEKDGEKLRTSKHIRLYESRGVFYLEIPEAEAEDAGEYVCIAVNSEGTITATVSVTMQGSENIVQISEEADTAAELMEGATGGVAESSSDEMFLKPFLVLMDYTDPDTKVMLKAGELVEVLDSKQKSGIWLVRGQVDKEKVIFAPSYLLCDSEKNGVFENKKEDDTDDESSTIKRRDKRLTHSPKYGSIEGDNDTSEDEFRLRGVYPDYVVVADYNPSEGEKNSIRLSEGQIVEIIDKERSDLWLVQTRPTKMSPSRQGWVPSAYLEEKSVSAQFMRRSRETFREEVLQVKNKQQEAGLKRRYVLKELEETEREYIRDLKSLIDNYIQPMSSTNQKLPELLNAGSDLLFSNISDIFKFHDGPFLQDLISCCANPSTIGATFLKWENEFYNYVRYWSDRDAANFILDSEDVKTFFKEFSKKQAIPGEAIFNLLNRPVERLKIYQLLLKDILRFSARAGDDCSQVEAAIAMLIAIEKEVGNGKLIPLLEGCDFDLTDLGSLIRHDDLCVWEGDVSSTRVKDRHVFLFGEKIVMTKKKKPENSSDKAGFTYRSSIDLANVRLKENVPEDDRRFELWFIGDATVDVITFQARSMFAKLAWVKDIRDALTKIGVIHPDHSSEKGTEGAPTPKASPQASPPRQQPSEAAPMKDQTSGKQKEQACEKQGIETDLTKQDGGEANDSDVSSYYTAPEPDSGSDHVWPSFGYKQNRVISTAFLPPTCRLYNPSNIFLFTCATSTYYCKYGNISGGDKASHRIRQGSITHIDCFVGRVSPSEISWSKDGKPIKEGDGICIKHQRETSSLIFSKTKASNSGKYTVTVVSSSGKQSTSVELIVVEELIETDTSTDKTNGDITDQDTGSETATEDTQEGVIQTSGSLQEGLIVITQFEDHQETFQTSITGEEYLESHWDITQKEITVSLEEDNKEVERHQAELKAREEAELKIKEEERLKAELKAKEEEERLKAELKAKEEEERLKAELKAKEEEQRLKAELKAKEEEERLKAELKAKEEEERLKAELKAKEEEEKLKAELKAKEEEEKLKAELKAKEEEEKLKAELKAKEEEERLKAELKAKEEEERLKAELKAKEEEERLKAELKAKEEEEKLKAELKAKEEEERLKAELKAKEEEERLKAELKAKEEGERLKAELKAKEEEEKRLKAELKAKEEGERLKAELKAKEEEEQRLKAELEAKEEEEGLKAELKAKEEEERLKAELKAKEEEEKLKAELKAKEEEERLKAELKAKEEEEQRLKAELKAKKEEERLKAELKAKEEEERLKAELKAKEEAELKAKEEEEHRLKAELKAKEEEEEERLKAELKAKEEEERLKAEKESEQKSKEKVEQKEGRFNAELVNSEISESEKTGIKFSLQSEVTTEENKKSNIVLDTSVSAESTTSDHLKTNLETQSDITVDFDSTVSETTTQSLVDFETKVEEVDSGFQVNFTTSDHLETNLKAQSGTSLEFESTVSETTTHSSPDFDTKAEEAKSGLQVSFTTSESSTKSLDGSVERDLQVSFTTTESSTKSLDSSVESNLQVSFTTSQSSTKFSEEGVEKLEPHFEFTTDESQSKPQKEFDSSATKPDFTTPVPHSLGSSGELLFETSVEETSPASVNVSFETAVDANSYLVQPEPVSHLDAISSVSISDKKQPEELSELVLNTQTGLDSTESLVLEAVVKEQLEEPVKADASTAPQQGEDKKLRAPQVTGKMDDCVTELGETARFDCRVSAYPDPEITWFKDGHKVVPSTKFELINFHDDIFSLLIKEVSTLDSGCYTCQAKNEYGEAKSEALLNVLDQKEKITDAHVAPCFLTKFYDIEAVEGVPVEFICVIYGNPEPTVTWLLNGKEVEISSEILTRRQEDSVMIAFRSVQLSHSGEIICKLKNDSGEAICKARLKVKEDISKRGNRPIFLEQPTDKEVIEGEEVTFECVISGLPDPDVTWYFNGRELYESRRRTMKRKAGQKYILTLREVVPENAGVYTCKAVNRAGDASCAVELSVKELPTEQMYKGVGAEFDTAKYSFPPSFTRRIQDTTSTPGRMVRFEAMVIGIPEPEVEWVKDGFPLRAGPKYKMGREGHTSILVVDNCDSIDEGTYTCNIYNDAGKASCSAQLRVQEEKFRPSVPRFYSPSIARESYTGSPPSIRRSIAREIPLEDKIPSMPIDKPVLLDIKSNSVKLSWMPAPTAGLPENAQRITYTIEARELPNNNWVRLEGNIEATTHYVNNLKPDKEYMFRVRADNRYGVSETTLPCTLKAREEPKRRESVLRETETPIRPVLPKTKPYVSDIGKETIQLGWKPAEIPYPGRSMSMPPVSYRVEAQKLPSEEWVPLASRVRKPSLYLSDLEPDRDYNIRVRAQTPYGVSQPTEPIWIPRAKAFTGVPVSRPTISEIEEGTARLQWNRVDIPAFDRLEEPLLYMIEMQEPPSYRWRELARRVPTNHYIVRDLDPAQDYRFRVRAESLDGLLSEPSPATSVFRTLALTHTPVDRLEVEEYDADLQSARLSWRRVEVPPYGDQDSTLLYMIEYETPQLEGWRPLVSGIPTTRYHVPDISPTDDYRFRVRALSPYGVSPPSYPTGLYRNLSPMRPLAQDLRISDLEPSGLRLSWRSALVPPIKPGEPFSYQIEALEYPQRDWRPLASNIQDTSYRLGGLKPSTDYSFRVRALTPSGLADPAPPVTLTSLPVRPRFPVREPIVTDLGSESVRLQWKPAELPYYSRHSTPITYNVEYQEIPGRDWTTASRGISDSSYVVRGLRSDRDYRFRICPETEYGAGEYSLPVHVHRRTAPILPTREPVLSNVTPSSATLSWPSASLLSGTPSRPILYRVEGREPPNSTWYDVANRVPSTSYNLQFLYPDQSYMFRVFADYDGVESEPTLAVYFPCRAGPPKMPRDAPYVSSVQPESLILSWRSVELPTRITDYSPVTYKIEVQEHPSSEWRPLERKIPQTHFHITKLRPDLDYSFRVRAENEYGVSDPTDAVLVRKRAVPPTLSPHEPLISDVRGDSLRLTWKPADVPSYLTDTVPITYTILMQEGGDPNWQPLARRVAGTSYYVTGLSPDNDYNFRIQAENNFGTSLPSLPSRLHRQTKSPIQSPEIEDVEQSALRLSWRQPSVGKKATYSVETLEPSTWKWRPLVSRLPHPSYKVTNIQPTRDYLFRVRAEVDSVVSEPSLPISFSNRRGLPTVPVERPTLSDIFDDTVRVSWHPTPYHGANRKLLPQAYRLEVRELPDSNWRTLVPYTDQWSYEVTDLRPSQDYAFRVRTVTDTGMSEPSLPVYLYRQAATPKFPLPSPEIADYGDDYISLGWKLVDIPAFDVDETPLSFMIEAQKLPDYDWRPVARGVTGMSHKVTGLEPKQDYNFRLRGETSIGVTQPSPPTSLYRRPLVSGVPIANVSIDRDSTQPHAARLNWSPVYMEPYKSPRDLRYVIEVQEPHHSNWSLIARDIPTTSYTVPELSPRKDYLFRIKAQLPTGGYSAPTTPIPFYRAPAIPSRQNTPVPYISEDYTPTNRPYIESLILKVPPRMSIEKPDMMVLSPDTVRLSWKAARVPSATANISPTTYRVEVRHEDSFEWMEKATRIPGLTTDIKGLNPHIDYAFRVRAVNDFGWSESTLPVFLHRPKDLKDTSCDHLFEPIETYTSLLGDTAPPKMPIDTPRMGLVQGTTMRLSWTPARIPLYARKTPITYLIEKKEPNDQDWITIASRIDDTAHTISSILPDQDYLFRVRAENEFGLSEATLPAALTRSKTPHFIRSSASREREMDISGSKWSSTYSYIDSVSSGVPPRVPAGRPTISHVTETSLTLSWPPGRLPSYMKGQIMSYIVEAREPPNHIWVKLNENVPATTYKVTGLRPDQDYMFRVRAFNDAGMSEPTLPVTLTRERIQEVEPRTRRRSSVERFSSVERLSSVDRFTSRERSLSTERSASIPRVLSREGSKLLDDEASQDIPAAPEFVEPAKVQHGIDSRPVQLSVQLIGYPLPTVDWYFNNKKIVYGLAVLEFSPMTWDDVGEYKCIAENESGQTTVIIQLQLSGDIPPATIYFKKSNFEDDYYILEELGRGSHSIVRRVIERSTGNEFAAKFTHVRGDPEKDFFRQELDPLLKQRSNKVVKLHDAYETQHSLILVEELIKEGNLLDRACQDNEWTENKVGSIIRLVLQALKDVHSTHVLHLDVEPTNIRFKSSEYDSLCLIDFNFARKLPLSSEITFNYGTPEFCSPETIGNESVTPTTDVWSVGILTHLLLTGTTPFTATSVPDILSQTQKCELNLDESLFTGISPTAQDFIARILVRDPQTRLSVTACLDHEWLKTADKPSGQKIDTSKLKSFSNKYLAQQKIFEVKTIANLRSLKRLSEGTVIQQGLEPTEDPQTGQTVYPDTADYGQFLDRESWYDWQFRHQHGPDAEKSLDDPNRPWRQKKDKELAVDETIKSTYKERLLNLDSAEIRPSLEKELEWLEEGKKLSESQEPDEVSLSSKRSSVASISTEGVSGPLFIEKLHDMAFSVNDNVRLVCKLSLATSPSVVWYRNEELLPDGGRYKIVLEDDGEASLTIKNAKPYDAGIYKCVGRTKTGRVSSKLRLELGDVPGRPGQPAVGQISSTEALVIWEAPASTGHSDILFYKVDYRSPGQERWTSGVYTDQEAAIINNLQPDTKYRFRVSATNRFGASGYSWASAEIVTKPKDHSPLFKDNHFDIAKLLAKQSLTQPVLPSEFEEPPQEEESDAVIVTASPDTVYNIGEVLYKGKFYTDKSITLPSDDNKLFILRTQNQKAGEAEFDILKSLRHERIVRLLKAFKSGDELHFVLEHNEGGHIASFLSQRRKYTEEMVTSVIRQVLYGLEFLQRSSLVHLNLQPASIVVSKIEGCVVKLTDFSLAKKLTNPVGELVPRQGYPDFIAPEVIVQDLAGYPADIWGIGVLTFLLLSGVSPFCGKIPEETLVNISLSRYDAADLYENVTADGLKFLFKVLKRTPSNRPTVQDCLEHRWLQLVDKNIKERESTVFLSNTLTTFVQMYDSTRQSDDFQINFEEVSLPIQMAKKT